jgi:hypothetical protein
VPQALDNVYTVVYTAGRLIEQTQEGTMSANAVWQMGEREIYDVCFEADDAPASLLPQICAHYLRQRWGREPSSAERAALVKRVRGKSVPTNVQG